MSATQVPPAIPPLAPPLYAVRALTKSAAFLQQKEPRVALQACPRPLSAPPGTPSPARAHHSHRGITQAIPIA